MFTANPMSDFALPLPHILHVFETNTQQKACRLQCLLHTKFETSYDKIRSETLSFTVKIIIMITQGRACKLQRLLQIQELDFALEL